MVLAAAAKYDLRVVLALTSNWQKLDGTPQYLAW